MRETLINHINKIHENIIPTPDAGGGYYQYPMQSILNIIKDGIITLSTASIFKLSKRNFNLDKDYTSVTLVETPNKAKYRYSVDLILGREDKALFIYDGPNVIKYRNVVSIAFNSFQAANDFYNKMIDKFNLSSHVYSLYRYQQNVDGDVPEYNYDEYIKLITTNVNTLL